MKHTLALGLLSMTLLAACAKNEPQATTVDVDTPIGSAVINTAMPQGEVAVPGHGKETGLAIGAISGLNDVPANGVASAHYFEDKSTIIGVQANIAVAEDGFFYEAWIAGETKDQWMSLGHMTNLFGDARHSTRFETPEDLQNRSRIVITRERDDGNPLPGEEVAEGILKPTKR